MKTDFIVVKDLETHTVVEQQPLWVDPSSIFSSGQKLRHSVELKSKPRHLQARLTMMTRALMNLKVLPLCSKLATMDYKTSGECCWQAHSLQATLYWTSYDRIRGSSPTRSSARGLEDPRYYISLTVEENVEPTDLSNRFSRQKWPIVCTNCSISWGSKSIFSTLKN